MPNSWPSYTGNSDSSSTYSTELSRPTINHHDSFFVEDVGRQIFNDENSKRAGGFSVYLDDTRLVIPPTPSDLNSSGEDLHSSSVALRDHGADRLIDLSSYSNLADRSTNTDIESGKNVEPSVAFYPNFNDSAYSGQSSDEIGDFNRRIALLARKNHPQQPAILERSDENCSIQPVLKDNDRCSDSSKPASGNQLNRVHQKAVQSDTIDIEPKVRNHYSVSMDAAEIIMYETVNGSLESSIKDSMDQKFEDANSEINISNGNSNESKKTVSTSFLINERDSWQVRASEQYPHIEGLSLKNVPAEEGDIDQMVIQLRHEAQNDIPPINCSSRPTSTEFVPQDLKLSQRLIPRRDSDSKKTVPRSPSLLNKILIPSTPDYAVKEIPVLRSVGSPRSEQRDSDRDKEKPIDEVLEQDDRGKNMTEFLSKSKPFQFEPKERQQVLSRPEGLTYSQVDIALESLKQFQEELRMKMGICDSGDDYDNSSNNGSNNSHDEKGYIPESIPFQRVDSSSANSVLSTNFWQKFSIWRIILVLLGCILVPPFFFMVAAGCKTGFPDFKIIKLITRENYRTKIWKGFLWDVNVAWFRWLCLTMGIIEVIGIFAGIAVGFGVGIGSK